MEVNQRSGDVGLLRDVTDPDQRLLRFKHMFDQSERADQDWRADVIENRRFLSNDQWTEGDRNRLTKQKRPMLTINKILPRVLFLRGMQASQREEPELVPEESGDARHAELMAALYKWFGSRSRESRIDSRVFDHKIVGGIGWWKLSWNFDYDPEGRLLWEAPDPLSIFVDPNFYDAGCDIDQVEYVIQANWLHLETALELWPDQEEAIRRDYGEWLSAGVSSHTANFGAGEFAGDTMASERSFWDPQTQRMRVLEVWYRKRVMVDTAVKADSGEVTTDPQRIAVLKQAVATQPELAQAFHFFRQSVPQVCVAHCSENVLLDDQPSPYKRPCLPFFPTVAYYWWRQPFGIVTPIKDLQREKNRRRSTVAEMVGRAALSGFFNHETQGAKAEDLENYVAGTGKVIPFKAQKPEAIDPPQLPQPLVFLDAASDRDMDQVSNINAELLGQSSQRFISGRALQRRQQAGMIVQEPLMTSFREDKEPAVRFAIGLIVQYCGLPRALRILGAVAARQPQSPMAMALGPMQFQDVVDLLQGAFDQEYDVTVSTKPYDPSAAQQKLDRLMELVQQFAPYIPPKVIVDALKDAGSLTEDQANQVLQYATQRMAADQAQQAAATAGQAPAPPNRTAGAA